MSEILRLSALAVTRGNAKLAHDISLAVQGGDLLLLTGPNGSGKTSFLRALAGVLTPSGGTITRQRDLHWLAAQPLAPSLETPRQYLAYQAALAGSAFALTDDPFGIGPHMDTPLKFLSTGWRQRVKLTRLVVTQRALWLLDEPSDGLDASGIETLQAMVRAHQNAGRAAVIATHDPHLWPQAGILPFGGRA